MTTTTTDALVTKLVPLAGALTVSALLSFERAPLVARLGGTAMLVGAAGAAGAGVTLASGGNRAYAGAVAWGLASAGLDGVRDRKAAVVVAAGAGLVAVGLATWIGARRRRSAIPPSPRARPGGAGGA